MERCIRWVVVVVGTAVMLAGCRAPAPPPEPVAQPPRLTPQEQRHYSRAESQLRSPDPEVRERAAVALLSMDHPQGVEAVREAILRGEEPGVRLSAIRAAAFCVDHRCFEAVLAAVEDPDPQVRQEAAATLARFTRPEEIQAVMDYLEAPGTEPPQRQVLYRALGQGLALRAVPALLRGLRSPDEESRTAAWQALRHISRRDLPLDPEQWDQWWEANSHRTREDLLQEHLQASSGVLEARTGELQELRDQHEELAALVGEPGAETGKALLEALQSRHALVRRYAAFRLAGLPDERLAGLSLDEQRTYAVLRDALEDDQAQVRQNVMRLVQRVGGEYKDRLVKKALQDTDPSVLAMAAESVSEDTGPDAIARLEELLRDSADPEVRVAAANVLGKVGSAESRAVLVAALEDPEENVRWFAVEGLRKLGATQAVPRISEILQEDQSARVRAIAATALGELGQPAGVPALRQALSDPAERVRQKAAAALLLLAADNYERMRVIADAFREHGMLAEAREVLTRVVDSFGDTAEMQSRVNRTRMELAEIMKEQADFAGAAQVYQQLEAAGQADAELARAMTECWLRAGQPQQVVDAVQRWLKAPGAPPSARDAVVAAEQLMEANQQQAARAVLDAAETSLGAEPDPELAERIAALREQMQS
ncbi:MAG: HEAT repeat domain-containing protein [Candidatus Brocadiia bacterium]